MYILRGLDSVADHVGLCESVAAEDVIEGFEGGGAVGFVSGQVVGGGEDLDVVEVVAC